MQSPFLHLYMVYIISNKAKLQFHNNITLSLHICHNLFNKQTFKKGNRIKQDQSNSEKKIVLLCSLCFIFMVLVTRLLLIHSHERVGSIDA